MKSSVFVAGAVLWCVALGCSSDDSGDEGAGGEAGSSSAGAKASSAGSSSGGSKTSGSAGSKTSGSAGSKTSGSAGSPSGDAGSSSTAMSPECQKYCDCHEQNCASSPIPDGKSCADFCAGFTAEQMECRQIHCILVPDQPDNDHCTHSLGIIQCL